MTARATLALALSLALAGNAHAAAAPEAARALAQDAVIVDTHIDAPGILSETWADLGVAAPDREFDYPRAREGGLDVAFMSIYTSAREDAEGKARQSAHAQIDSVEALAARHPDRFALLTSPGDVERLREGGRVRYEERMHRSDGSFRDVQVTKVLVTSNDRQPVGILIVKLDITEFLAARDQAEDASRSKSEFVANISHELRTPLQTILGFSELGMSRGRHQTTLASMFSDIHDAGQRMLVLVNDLLDIAKIESTVGAFHFERADVRDLIEDVAAELELQLEKKRQGLGLQLGRAPLVAKVDPTRLQQVVRNVLGNAMKFSPEDSIIDIAADNPDDNTIRIQIRDRGPGIPPAELDAVFQAFVQSSQTRDGSGGTGLGLAICRKIITAHGGSIHATNAPGGGTIFHISLPTAGYTDTMPATLS